MIANDLTTFNSESIDGGSITAYDVGGNPVNVEFRWAKVSSAASGGANAWQLFYQTNADRHRHASSVAERRHDVHVQCEPAN